MKTAGDKLPCGEVETIRYLAFLDESGTPDLNPNSIDRDFPVFTLACCIFEYEYYLNVANPLVDRFKYRFFQHRNVVLHSSEIRKRRNEFSILANAQVRNEFMEGINKIVEDLEYNIIASSIIKEKHLAKYTRPRPPYDLTFEFIYEKIFFYFKNFPNGPHECFFIAESRNDNENTELKLVYDNLRSFGNRYLSGEEFRRYVKGILFTPKKANETGNQICDLVAYPISRIALDRIKDYKPADIVFNKIYKGPDGTNLKHGLKIFP